MSLEDDYKLALRLQKEIDEEEKKRKASRNDLNILKPSTPSSHRSKPFPHSSKTLSLVDKSLEYTDPNPDIHSLFIHFNDVFFWGKLSSVEVKWSPRMTSCAGICCYQGRGGLCSIRLSLPLLKLRPRKDLVETLLHEMIHAYLFVTCNNRDRDGHGPEFHKHMHRINQSAGTKITVYHSFHDEVRSYQQHWWQCQGPCRHRKPYFGKVRRAMNRAPGPSDFWWKEHQANCGGEFIKVREPEGFSTTKKGGRIKVKGKSESASSSSALTPKNNKSAGNSIPGIQKYFSPTKSGNVIGSKRDERAVTKSPSPHVFLPKQLVSKKKESSSNKGDSVESKTSVPQVPFPKNFVPNKLDSTVDKNKTTSSVVRGNTFVPFSGTGRVLGSLKSSDGKPLVKKPDSEVKSSSGEPLMKKPKSEFKSINGEPLLKKPKSEVKCPVCGSLQLEENINDHLDSCIEGEGSSAIEQWKVECPGCRGKIKEEAFDDHLEECMSKRPPEEIILLSSDDEEEGKSECVCPACGKTINSLSLAQHLDLCLSSMSFDEDME